MNTITFQSSIKKVTTRVDNTLDIVLGTQELPEAQMAQLFTLRQKHCAVAIAPHGEEMSPMEPVTIDAPKGRSSSQRLRAVLYKLWQQNPEGHPDSEKYYEIKMNQIIEHLKSKLN